MFILDPRNCKVIIICNFGPNFYPKFKIYKKNVIPLCKNLEIDFYLIKNIFLRTIDNLIILKKKI